LSLIALVLFTFTATTTMLDNRADLRHIQEMHGHASILTTQLYTNASRKKLSQVYENTHPSAQGGNGLF
jgi:integrase/recombinase XerD